MRLRAALEALGPDDSSCLSRSRRRRAAPRTAVPQVVVLARAEEQAANDGNEANAMRSARSASTAAVAGKGGEDELIAGDLEEGLAHEPAEAVAAPIPRGDQAARMTGAERALQSLRRELAAGLRSSWR